MQLLHKELTIKPTRLAGTIRSMREFKQATTIRQRSDNLKPARLAGTVCTLRKRREQSRAIRQRHDDLKPARLAGNVRRFVAKALKVSNNNHTAKW